MKKVGFLVDDLGPSQSSYFLIRSLNGWLAKSHEHDAIVFQRTTVRPCSEPRFALFTATDLPGFQGPVISTSFSCAQQLLKTQGPCKLAYYMQDVEWLRQARSWEEWQSVFANEHLQILTRGSSHARLFRQCWNREVSLVEDFNMEQILEALEC